MRRHPVSTSRRDRPRPARSRTAHLRLVGHPGSASPAAPPTGPVPAGPRALPGSRSGIRLVHVGDRCDCGRCEAPSLPAADRFGYTIGLTGIGQPELLLRGHDSHRTAAVLGRWAEAVAEGDRFAAGHLLCEGPGGPCWRLVPVPDPGATLLWTAHYYRRPRWPAIQALELVATDEPCHCPDCR